MAIERLNLQVADKKNRKRVAIREAVVEADKGIFISQGKMDAWVSSWGARTRNSHLPNRIYFTAPSKKNTLNFCVQYPVNTPKLCIM